MVLTNVYGAALTIRAALPALKESKGHLLLTGSVAGRRAIPGSLYSATKHAVHAMGESARQELDGTGVRVTVIAPGMTDTPFFDAVPLDAPLEPDDIARAVHYALSQPPHVDVNEILVRPTPSRSSGLSVERRFRDERRRERPEAVRAPAPTCGWKAVARKNGWSGSSIASTPASGAVAPTTTPARSSGST